MELDLFRQTASPQNKSMINDHDNFEISHHYNHDSYEGYHIITAPLIDTMDDSVNASDKIIGHIHRSSEITKEIQEAIIIPIIMIQIHSL